MASKIYAPGQAKERQTPFGPVVRWGVKVEDLIAFANQHVNDRGFINLEILPRREPGRFGDTHSVVLDDFRPTPRNGETTTARGDRAPVSRHSEPLTDDDIPFAWLLPLILPALLSLHVVLA